MLEVKKPQSTFYKSLSLKAEICNLTRLHDEKKVKFLLKILENKFMQDLKQDPDLDLGPK